MPMPAPRSVPGSGPRFARCTARIGAAALLAAACAWRAAAALTVVDDDGTQLHLAAPAARIVALSPGITEMLFAAGAGARLVASVEYADEPPAARALPRVGNSAAVDLERLLVLHPDVVVVWPGGNSPAQIARVAALGIPVYRQRLSTLGDIAPAVRRLGRLAGTAAAADAAAARLEGELAALRTRYAGRAPVRVLLETWNRPIYTIGGPQLMSDALAVCGARNVFADLAELSPAVQLEAVIARDPDAIIAAAPPGAGAGWLEPWRRWPRLTAVRHDNLVAFEDQALSRMGPSVIGAAARLCALIDGMRARLAGGNQAAPSSRRYLRISSISRGVRPESS